MMLGYMSVVVPVMMFPFMYESMYNYVGTFICLGFSSFFLDLSIAFSSLFMDVAHLDASYWETNIR